MAASWRRIGEDFVQRMAQLEKQIHELAGKPFNVGSPKQLGEILFDEMKLPGGRRSKATGAWGTDAAVLEEVATQGSNIGACWPAPCWTGGSSRS